MRITDDHGVELDAAFSVEVTSRGADVILESRGGADSGTAPARNSDYAPGLELLLVRLAASGAVLADVLLESRVALPLPLTERRLLAPDELPIPLSTLADVASLRHRIGRASAAFGRPPGSKGGNPTKRIRIVLDWPAAMGATHGDLERQLGGAVPIASGTAVAGSDWTEAELRACVEAYRGLWLAQEEGRKPDKTALRRDVVARSLPGRSESAYEYRMHNISSVIEDLGMPVVTGYRPLRNVGRQKPVIVRLINEVWDREGREEAVTDDPGQLETRVEAARAKLRRRRRGGPLPPPPEGASAPPRLPATTTRYPRDPNVIAWVLEAAAGVCEVCETPAPFHRADGEPFLEVHHVRQLAEGGPDRADNAVAGCPNCHRRLHHGADREALRRQLLRRLPRLRDHPRLP